MKFGILKGLLIITLGNILALSSFASSNNVHVFSKKDNPINAKRELAKIWISIRFNNHIQNLTNKNCWVFEGKYKSSIDNILTEISNSMLDICPYAKSAKYSDGSKIAEFFKEEGFNPISAYQGANWNYVVLMNLLQNMRNRDIESIKYEWQKIHILDEVVMDIRNANIRQASQYDYDRKHYIESLNHAANDILQYFDSLDLWRFVLRIKQKFYKPTSPVQKNTSVPSPMQITRDQMPHGIKNEGGTCYLNAVLQCLYNSAPIRTAIQKLSQSPQNKLAQQINNIFLQLATNGTNELDFNGAVSSIARHIGMDRISNKQPSIGNQDPAEAIGNILDTLIDEEIAPQLSRINQKYSKQSDASKKGQLSQNLRHHSTIGQICDIKCSDIITCNKCDNRSTNDTRLTKLDLALLKAHSKEILLHDLIRSFEAEEILNDTNKCWCPNCKRNEPASKRIVLNTLPKVLCLSLKRYEVKDKKTSFRGDTISFPDVIKIRQYKYKLRSFVYGGYIKGGHIIMEGYADDATPYTANDGQVLIKGELSPSKAQMLFYERME